jgi:hypothetical protein
MDPVSTRAFPPSSTRCHQQSVLPTSSPAAPVFIDVAVADTNDPSSNHIPLLIPSHLLSSNASTFLSPTSTSTRSRACAICYGHKVKCDGLRPCDRYERAVK